ncbi:MAG: hypothetical protein HRU19_28845 [Pseudobacteriovorax sp.]|nr:hypothetical protein [Pseudobacteriovorax sp.]
MEPNEIAELIFHTGFSTAQAVSDVSGRGVGMAAIRESLRSKGGDAYIHVLGHQQQHFGDDFVPFELILMLPRQFFIHKKSCLAA